MATRAQQTMNMRKHFHASTNNSATRVFMLHDGYIDTGRVTITTEADLYKAMQQCERPTSKVMSTVHNVDEAVEADKLDNLLRAAYSDREFREKYSYQSLFLIGAGVYGHVFRVVSNASGPIDNPLYNENYTRFLQILRRTKSRRKLALLDSYRDALCLDLVAMKVEVLSTAEIEFQSANKVQLAKEFCMLTELYKNQSSSNALVGFPLPIEFGFLGSHRAAKDLRKVMVFDTYGRPSNYQEAYLNQSSVLQMTAQDVTLISYMTMELVGPNLDEWKRFFEPTHSKHGHVVFSAQTTLKLMDQVLCRLLVMHRKNMVHLDLKPDNICMGVGKMTNTVYLLDYGLSRLCSDDRPNITMGSRRYMSVGVLNFDPANFLMDIESWFYVLIVLLTDFVPWSSDLLSLKLGSFVQEDQDQLMMLMSHMKKQFWGDGCNLDKKLVQQVVDKAEMFHRVDVPDIGAIILDIYMHVKQMRRDFNRVSSLRMHADIKNEESDLFKRYHTLRKLLLFPYDIDFTGKGSCFANDKDVVRKRENRRLSYPMLVFAEHGRNWHWDWDVWFDDNFAQSGVQGHNLNNEAAARASARRSREKVVTPPPQPQVVVEPADAAEQEPAAIPEWMRHYLARVLGSMEQQSVGGGSGGGFNTRRAPEPEPELESILVA